MSCRSGSIMSNLTSYGIIRSDDDDKDYCGPIKS